MPGNDIMSPGQPHRSQPEGSLVVTLKTKIILDFTELKLKLKNRSNFMIRSFEMITNLFPDSKTIINFKLFKGT